MEERFRQLYIVCGALMASVVLVNLTLLVLLKSEGLQPSPPPDPVPLVLFAVGLTLLVAAPAVKGAVFKRADAEGFGGDPGRRFAAYRTATIVAFALREAGGLIGFVLSMMTANPWWSWGLGGAAIIAMLVDWPKPGQVGG